MYKPRIEPVTVGYQCASWQQIGLVIIRRESDYIIGLITPAIGLNKSKKLTRLIAPVHNIRGMYATYMASQTTSY